MFLRCGDPSGYAGPARILDYQVRFQPAYVFAIILVVILEGVLLMEIARRLETRLGQWKGSVTVE